MSTKFSFYAQSDFGRVLRFFDALNGGNDTYDTVRFQFALGLHIQAILGGLQGGFERTCGIWEDEAGIAALVMTEGGTRWAETFFVFRSDADKTQDQMRRMCEFAERFTSRISEDRKHNSYSLSVPASDQALAGFVQARGYEKTSGLERIMVKEYAAEPETVVLPDGYSIRDARTVPAFYSALAHQHAFRYNQQNDGSCRAFDDIRGMPGYRADLDLVVFDPEGQPAGLANFWIVEQTRTAVLEPLGVVWWHRKKGLGRALIYEGINRTRRLGCTSMVGGDQPFYTALGFETVAENHFWAWASE